MTIIPPDGFELDGVEIRDGKAYAKLKKKKESEYFNFGEEITITPNGLRIFIGKGIAPKRLRDRCLMFPHYWEIETGLHNGFKYVAFKEK